MGKYTAAYSLALQQVLQRRSTLLMDRLGGVAILVSLYYFWSALLVGRDNFLGYTGSQMLSYVLAMSVLRSFAFTGRGWELVGDISSGRISGLLVRPIDYRGYSLALDMANKSVHLAAAILEIAVLMIIVKAPLYIPESPWTWVLFAAATLVSSLVFFFLEFLIASFAFWTSESAGPLFCFELFLQFAAGAFFPLDVLPAAAQSVLNLTPFPYLVFFPIHIYLERLSTAEALQILAIQGAWLVIGFLAVKIVWTRGLQSYSADGG